jgi:putative ABC transport system substrate-binding protein
MASYIRRRKFLAALVGVAAAAWPLAARAQQVAIPVIGHLYSGSPEQSIDLVAAFRQALSESGYVEGRNIAIEYRFANNDNSRLPGLAADLVHRHVAVIAAAPTPAAIAAQAATNTIPIVFGVGGDPVELGLVASLNRPGGNVTGTSDVNWDLAGKRLQLLHELVPAAVRFGLLVGTKNASVERMITDVQSAARTIGIRVEVLPAGTPDDIDATFAMLAEKRIEALMVNPDPLFSSRRVQLVTLAARHAVPTIWAFREDATSGGLMSYGSSLRDRSRKMAQYAARILNGDKPSDLPVIRADKFEFILNRQSAKLIGLTVPPTLLSIADEVIE